MASVLQLDNSREHMLRGHHIFGRNAERADSCVNSELVSRIHAALEWSGEGWYVRDLSRNGTWLNGQALPKNQAVAIARGGRLQFGSPKEPVWSLQDDSAPRSMLVAETAGEAHLPLEQYTFVPSEEAPEWVVFFSPERGAWQYSDLVQGDEEPVEHRLQHGDVLACGGKRWRAFMVGDEGDTRVYNPDNISLADYEFVFDLSLDEESTQLQLHRSDEVVDLGERSHHYLLAHLARERAQHARDGLDNKSQGWVDNHNLSRQLGIEPSHLNILIYRARKQVAEQLVSDAGDVHLVERRKGRVRFGYPNFKVYKGDALTHELHNPAAA